MGWMAWRSASGDGTDAAEAKCTATTATRIWAGSLTRYPLCMVECRAPLFTGVGISKIRRVQLFTSFIMTRCRLLMCWQEIETSKRRRPSIAAFLNAAIGSAGRLLVRRKPGCWVPSSRQQYHQIGNAHETLEEKISTSDRGVPVPCMRGGRFLERYLGTYVGGIS